MTERLLLAEVFICRADRFLILQRAGGRGKGAWGPPGGMVEPGENTTAAAVREVLEETDLRIEEPEILRRWRWQLVGDSYVRDITALTARAPAGDIRLGGEHTDYDWISPAQYSERFCSPRLAQAAPEYAGMFAENRMSCMLVAIRMGVAPHS